MFGMGWQEILLILVVAVLVIGPDQLPQVARTIGKMIAQFRRMTNDLRDSVNREFNSSEEFRDFREFQNSIDAEVRDIGQTAQAYVDKEVAKEESELKKLEQEVREAGDPGPLGDPPGEPQDSWTYQPDLYTPEDAPAGDAPAAAEPSTTAEDDHRDAGPPTPDETATATPAVDDPGSTEQPAADAAPAKDGRKETA